MAETQFAYASGFDQTTLTLIEDLILDAPSVMDAELVSELGPVKQRTLNKAVQRNGSQVIHWNWEWMSHADWLAYIPALYGGWDVGSVELTIRTLSEAGAYVLANAVFDRPYPGEDFQTWHGGDIKDLVQTITIEQVLTTVDDSGLLDETGLGLLDEAGEFILEE